MEARGETVLVVIKANRSKESLETLNWALKRIVRPKDTVIALGYLPDNATKNPCFPFLTGLGISGLWERLEFPGQGEVSHGELDELEIEKKREQYGRNLQPFYQQCIKNEVNLELRLFSGICLIKLTVEEAKNSNAGWIVLDSYLKNFKEHIKKKISCNLVVAKGKDIQFENSAAASSRDGDENVILEKGPSATLIAPEYPSWYPLSWTSGFPRAFDHCEIEMITNGFDEERLIMDADGMKIYQGILQDTPVLVTFFSDYERFQSQLNILSNIRHRNIMNIVGYCSTAASKWLLSDHPNAGTLEMHLRSDDLAMDFGWKARWCAALEIGGCLRYLHEECADGPICQLSICSAHVSYRQGYSALLGNFATAKMLTDNVACKEDSPADCKNLEEDEGVSSDVRDYGVFLLELITGKSTRYFKAQGEARSLVDWAIPLLENDSFTELMDSRLADSSDTKVVRHMANAAFCCLKNVEGQRQTMSDVLAVVRGDDLAISKSMTF